jgi:hypothetical protein
MNQRCLWVVPTSGPLRNAMALIATNPVEDGSGSVGVVGSVPGVGRDHGCRRPRVVSAQRRVTLNPMIVRDQIG